MATVVIGIDDHYQLKTTTDNNILRHGQFVNILIHGKQLNQVVSIPRDALRSGQQVWIADAADRLRLRPVEILRREQQQLLLASGVSAGERLILTTIAGAADGLLLRPVVQEQSR